MEGPIPTIFVNGKKVLVPAGTFLLSVLEGEGISVPHLCYDPRFPPSSACRLCLVEVKGEKRWSCACSTSVREGMEVKTHSPELEQFRKVELQMLARDAGNDSSLEKYLKTYDVQSGSRPSFGKLVDRTHPYIDIDMNRCIDCYRCVHICDQVQGQFVWDVVDRGSEIHFLPDMKSTLLESSCVSCGACVDTCPTGALEDKKLAKAGKADRWVRTTCPYCAVGCELDAAVKDDKIVGIKPSLDGPSNKGHLCSKGRYAFAYVDAPDRIMTPMVRVNGKWQDTTWDEALTAAAEGFRKIKDAYGGSALGVLGSARATNEDSFLAQKFARAVLSTNNVDSCARVCHAPSAAGLSKVFGTGAATNSFDDIERAALFLIIGANPTENHPVVGARIKQQALRGTPLLVIDPRRTELAGMATIHLPLRPGTNVPLLNAMAHVIVAENLHNQEFIGARTVDFETFRQHIVAWTPERAAAICELPADQIRRAARLYAETRPAMCFHGLGVTENIQGTDGVMAIAQLAILTGNVGIPGAGVNPLRGQNNVQGTAVMGCEPNRLTGSQKFSVAGQAHEQQWGIKLPRERGKTLLDMIDAAGVDELRGMLLVGYDVFFSTPEGRKVEASLRKLQSMVVVDLFLNETAKEFGTVFLPAVSSYERDGTFMNSERRVQRVRRAVSPRGQAKPDWEIICLLAGKLGAHAAFSYKHPEEIWNEIRTLWPAVRGMSYGRLESKGLQWPCPDENHPGTEILHQSSFPIGDRAQFKAIDYVPTGEIPDVDYPFVLNTGRTLYHFNAATMTGRTENIQLQSDLLLQVHPADAARLAIADGTKVSIESRYGSFEAVARLTDTVGPGQLFSSFHNVSTFVNRAVGGGRDPIAHTPEFKTTAVRVRPLARLRTEEQAASSANS